MINLKGKSKAFIEAYERFADAYDLTTINNANDAANVELFITNSILIQQWQVQMNTLTDEDPVEHITTIKKLSDAVRDTIETNRKIEQQLGIDRKSRKKDASVSTAEYIMHLKETAREFADRRLIRVYCPDCKVMVFRFSPVHEHTAFGVGVQCSQCGKLVTAERTERDVLFDLKPNDRNWRKLYPVKIKQPKKKRKGEIELDAAADIVISDDEDEDAPAIPMFKADDAVL